MPLCEGALRIALTDRLEHANPPDPLALLGARSERPRNRAAEERYEIAPFHCTVSPVLRQKG
jgi:hypothetical protein